jgi:hypothetical protein
MGGKEGKEKEKEGGKKDKKRGNSVNLIMFIVKIGSHG